MQTHNGMQRHRLLVARYTDQHDVIHGNGVGWSREEEVPACVT